MKIKIEPAEKRALIDILSVPSALLRSVLAPFGQRLFLPAPDPTGNDQLAAIDANLSASAWLFFGFGFSAIVHLHKVKSV